MDKSGLFWTSKIARFFRSSSRPPQASKATRNFMRSMEIKLGDPRTAIPHFPVEGTAGVALRPDTRELLYVGHGVGGKASKSWSVAEKELSDGVGVPLSAEKFSARIKPHVRKETTRLTLWSCRLAGSDYLQKVSNELGIEVRGFDTYIGLAGFDEYLGLAKSTSQTLVAKPPFLNTWAGKKPLRWHSFYPAGNIK